MSQFDTLAHLTRPAVEKLPIFEQQPPNIETRYVVKCTTTASVEATCPDVKTETWFKSPPLAAQTIRMIRAVKLFAESHDQGYAGDIVEGNWTWFQLAIFSSDKDTTPKKGSDGQELVVTSHANRVNSSEFEWLEGGTVDQRRIFLQEVEPGNVIAVQVCARFRGWKMFASNGYLVIDVGQDNRPYPIIPIEINTTDAIPPRRNVQTWYNESKTNHKTGLEVSLFIRALKVFQQLSPENQLSYYRIAGIHGYPYNVPWNLGKPVVPLDDPRLDELQKTGEGGWYCQHNNDLFPTWHRVYMMLYERRISDIMMDEAKARAKESDEWTQAAKRWRLPYWDWAADTSLPEIACDKTIRVIKSWDGRGEPQTEEIDNSMYRFQMPGLKPMGDASYGNYRIDNKEDEPWELCVGTSRHGISLRDPERRWVQGETNVAEVNRSLQGTHEQLYDLTLKDSVFRLLTEQYSTKYVRFASTKYDKDAKQTTGEKAREYLNLEQIHNSVHNFVGGDSDRAGYGHMSSVAVAAFDPVFWLHHCNIDRLLHLWQSSNPGNWFHQKKGQSVDNSPQEHLVPFHVSGQLGDFYNSNKVRNVDALNYSYDYMEEITDAFGDMIPEKSHLYINKLYGPAEEAFKAPAKELDPVINVVYNRYAFSGRAYFLLFFLGDIDRTLPYKKQASLIGSVFTFSTIFSNDQVTCRNCYAQQRAHVLSRAQIPITRVVPSARRLDRGMAKAFLGERLKWVAVYEDGKVADKGKLGDVQITLSIGLNELRRDVGRKSLFKFEGYQDLAFDWENAYAE